MRSEPVLGRRGTRRGRALASTEELAAGAIALESFQQVTQQADGKANILVAAHLGSMVLATTQLGQIGQATLTGPAAVAFWIAFWVVSVAYLVSFVVSGYLLIKVIRPRIGAPNSVNPFALSTRLSTRQRRCTTAVVGTAELAAKLWEVAELVARIALVKNAYLIKAAGWVATTVVLAVGWLVVVGVTG